MFATEVTPFLFSSLQPTEREWLEKSVSPLGFVLASRKIRRVVVSCPDASSWAEQANQQAWTLDHWARVWIAAQLSETELHRLFDTAEIREWVALVSALPWLSHPEAWLLRATDAVRSNIGDVLDAIAFFNPYPERYFTESAWNQLILKVLFNDKPLANIQGLSSRQNQALAQDILLLAKERWAAGRDLASAAWQLIVSFPSDEALRMVEMLAQKPRVSDQQAAQLVLAAWHRADQPTNVTWHDII